MQRDREMAMAEAASPVATAIDRSIPAIVICVVEEPVNDAACARVDGGLETLD